MKPDEFIREVNEELQHERLTLLWKRFGPLAIGVAVVIVLATAGKVGWDAWKESELQSRGETMYAAERELQGGKFEDAARSYADIAAAHSGGVAAIARMREALARHRAGRDDEAIEALDDIASDHADDPIIADLAKLQVIFLKLDESDPQEMVAALEPLAAAGRPWQYSARELQATAALRAGNTDLARRLLNDIVSDATTPQAMRARSGEFLEAIGGKPDIPAADDNAQSDKEDQGS
ncbi:MAG: tetratricopeptide repeat protein [Geminicoccaceae bacterium]|nr:tetratricopeptide repeat protein [Geminicoccaceae bacterium]MCB9944856.1 tetratricopeptide repeat protein [Geminicoccaceae bacterium]